MSPDLPNPDDRAARPPQQGGLGETLRALRRSRGLTLDELAERLRARGESCSKSYLSELETGRRPVPSDDFLRAAEGALCLAPNALIDLAGWERTPSRVRSELDQLRQRAALGEQAKARLARQLRELVGRSGIDHAWKSGELESLVREFESPSVNLSRVSADARTPATTPVPALLPLEVPLINSVAAGYPREFTDLGYPSRVADEYVRVPDIADPDAFAARVVGDSMSPNYLEGDIVVFSPARAVKSGSDCFARLEPDQQTTFKRVYFENLPGSGEMIRLQPINPSYPPRTLPREQVAGLYAAVSVVRRLD
jgi:repressor LexA